MFPAEIQRIVLMVALAAVAYLMVLAWNDDKHKAVSPETISSAPVVAPGTESAAPPVDAAVPAAPTAPATDVPDASLLGTVQPEPTTTAAAAAPTDRLIRIDTRVLSVWIDRLGGDIVRVQLPRYPMSLEQRAVPFLLLDSGNGHTYVAQSGLIGRDGPDAGGARPLYSTTTSRADFSAAAGRVELVTTRGDIRIRKIFEFAPDDYVVQMRYEIDNGSAGAFEAALFAQLKRDRREPYGTSPFTLGPKPYLGAALTTAEERYQKVTFDDLDDGPFRAEVTGGWMAMLQHYFLSAWVPGPTETNRYYGQKRSDGTYTLGFTGPVQQIAAGGRGDFSARFYAGPKDQNRLEAIAPNLNLTVDYGFLWWLAVPLFHLLEWLHTWVGNWGVAIILLTLAVKLALYPLSAASYKSMANMRRVAPQLKRVQERYADDRQKLSQEMMALYQKEKVNPLGGCLPMLLQMPVFISLYWVLFESVELRQAPFFAWIQDLAAMDPYFVLPILMGASQFIQMQLSPPPPDPMQAKVMKIMPIMFTVLFLFFPSGLVLYWLVNNVLSISQQWYITRQVEAGSAGAKT
jgi:YidC/Oxa1 family membrane protein insertase